jgi:putative copper export protein
MMSAIDPLMLAGTGLKLALYGAALFVIGTLTALAAGVVERDGTRAWLVRAAWSAVALIVIAAARLGLSVLQMGDPGMAAMVWQVQAATTTALLAGAALTLALFLLAPGWIRTALSAIAACLVAASFALTGHGQALSDPGFVPLIVGGHVLLAGFWVGALWILWPTPLLRDCWHCCWAEALVDCGPALTARLSRSRPRL